MFLHLEGIAGESDDAKFKDKGYMEISAWSTGYEQPVSLAKSATGPTIERVTAEPITITKTLDSSTYALLQTIWAGRVIETGFISCWRADHTKDGAAVEYLKIEMAHIVITTYGISGGEGEIPQEELALSAGYVGYIYKPQAKIGGEHSESPMTADFNFIHGAMMQGTPLKGS